MASRTRRRCRIGTYRLNQPVANNDGGPVEDLPRFNDHFAADQRVNAWGDGAIARRQKIRPARVT